MNSQMSPAILPMLLTRAKTAWQRAWDALLALAEALPTLNSNNITDKLDKAKAEQKQAKAVMEELQAADNAVVSPAEARGTLGDEDDEKLRENGDLIWNKAKELEEEREQAQKHQKWLQTGHRLLLGLLTLCGFVLSLDVVRATLGIAEDSHLLLALGTVAVSCQVAAQALGTSRGHLGDTAREHRAMAQKLYDHAQQVATAKAKAKDAAAIKGDITNAEEPLDEVTRWLGMLVDAVNKGMVKPEQKFTEAQSQLKDILKALKTSGRHGGDMAQRLKEVQEKLAGQGDETGRGHGGGAVTSRDTGDLLALGTPGPL